MSNPTRRKRRPRRSCYLKRLGVLARAGIVLAVLSYLGGAVTSRHLNRWVLKPAFLATAGTASALALVVWLKFIRQPYLFHFYGRHVFLTSIACAVVTICAVTPVANGEQQKTALGHTNSADGQLNHSAQGAGNRYSDSSQRANVLAARPSPPRSSQLWQADYLSEDTYFNNMVPGLSRIQILSDADMRRFRSSRQLQHLSLDFHGDLLAAVGADDGVTDAGMQHLKNLVHLRVLSLCNAPKITDVGLNNLKEMRELEWLSLSGMPRITDASLAIIGKLPHLRALTISGASIKGDGLRHLEGLKHLKELDLSGNPLNESAMEHVGRLAQLEALFLSNTPITNAGLQHIRKLNRLEVLAIDGTQIGDEGLESLGDLKNLRILWIAGTRIGDRGLAHLKDLRQLKELDISRTKVSDAGLKYLSELSNLRTLKLDDTRVTEAGRKQLKALPQFGPLDFDGPVIWMRFDFEDGMGPAGSSE